MLLIIISIALLQLFPLSITGVKHRLLPQLSNAIFDAASLCQLVFICHRRRLPRHPSLLANTCCRPLPPAAVAIKCHLCRRRPSPSSLAASFKCLQMPRFHLHVSAHRRQQRLQREAESSGRRQCFMTMMVGVAAVAGGGSAGVGCR